MNHSNDYIFPLDNSFCLFDLGFCGIICLSSSVHKVLSLMKRLDREYQQDILAQIVHKTNSLSLKTTSKKSRCGISSLSTNNNIDAAKITWSL
jgi:D-serine dehydratase